MDLNKNITKIYCSSITPFEKIGTNYASENFLPEEKKKEYMQFWNKILSSKNNKEIAQKYFHLLNLDDDKINKMFSSVGVNEDLDNLPEWVGFLRSILNSISTQGKNIFDKKPSDVPFIYFLRPFSESFRTKIIQSVSDEGQYLLTQSLLDQLVPVLLSKLSNISQLVFQNEFDTFKEGYQEKVNVEGNGTGIYEAFILKNLNDKLITIFLKYPMLPRLLCRTTLGFVKFIADFLNRFSNDRNEIAFYLGGPSKDEKISKVIMDLGDQHEGESTSILEFESGFKLVYKPGSAKVTKAYNETLNWINSSINAQLKMFKVIDKQKYGWLEFVEYQECKNIKEIENYYKKAGMLLGVTYFLNSTDYHYENLIAAGNSPVLIDHETIIGPLFKREDSAKETDEDEISRASILHTALLPLKTPIPGSLPNYMSGFGSSKTKSVSGWVKAFINCNTDASKGVVRTKTVSTDKLNKPSVNGQIKNLADYQDSFKEGFRIIYSLFKENSGFLLSKKSPLRLFKNSEIRFVWRPTNIYFTIQQQLYKPEFMGDAIKYGLKIELLARAYLKKHNNLLSLLNSERQQMIGGDVPIFRINSEVKILHFKNKEFVDIFELDCIDNLKKKMTEAGEDDYIVQTKLLEESLSL
jgi:type 2 lantibiotic biosynthesis protein LanM